MLTRLVIVSMLIATELPGQAPTSKSRNDVSWIRSFTVPAGGTGEDRASLLNGDPRFAALLKSSLPQHQFFWHDHGRFIGVPDLVQTFLGITDKASLVDQRYAVVNGCVPHDCGDRGMVWIDTQSASRPPLIFVATDHVNGDDSDGPPIHLWLFSSTKLNWQQLPPSFVSSVLQWWNSTSESWAKFYNGHRERVVIVSLVQPSGEIVSLSPDLFPFNGQVRNGRYQVM